jgi:hypothetical protein
MLLRKCDRCGYEEIDKMGVSDITDLSLKFKDAKGHLKRAEVMLCDTCEKQIRQQWSEITEKLDKQKKEQHQKCTEQFFTEEMKQKAIKKWSDYEDTFEKYDHEYY